MSTFSKILRFSSDPSTITSLGITLMLMLLGFIYYYFYSMASSSNSSAPKKEESSSYSSTSASSIQTSFEYDVFISFRGEDTRDKFVSHLYQALIEKGIVTYMDDKEMKQGKTIDNQLIQAIRGSRFFIIVFSKNYASSSWCLNELVEIMECLKTGKQTAYPIFLDVEPTDVRKQGGAFGKAFLKNSKKDKDAATKWEEALKGASNLNGYPLQATTNGNEAELKKIIVGKILLELRSISCGFDENLVGMESRVGDVKSLLRKGDNDVLMIGIWGMGGIGKTTIAKAVYHQIKHEFDGSSFVNDVRENGSDKKGLKTLQEKLLSEILVQENYTVRDCDDGKDHIQKRLRLKKVLVVLDDVNAFEQLQFLAGSSEWFGPGSRIIVTTRDKHFLSSEQVITTRDKHFLSCAREKDKYSPELLNQTEALRLFSRYAFRAFIPPNDFKELSCVAVRSTGYLPLALKVLGSHFLGRNLDFWQSSLKVLPNLPRKKINKILMLSYDGLEEQEQKMFLYIACFFKGDEKLHVERILGSLDPAAVSGITILIDRSLLTIVDGKLHMHDLIQEMGQRIVKGCHPDTMLWDPEKVEEVMMTNTVTRRETVEAIEHEHYRNMTCYDVDVFKSMLKLRLLILRRSFTSSEPTCFLKQLRWLRWSQYPFESLTLTSLGKLVGFEMPFSGLKQLQIEEKVSLPNIKFMDLRHSSKITSFPDVTALRNLESLILLDCDGLVEVHQSVLLHDKIKHLDLSYCCKLKFLPPSIQMISLERLLLECCSRLERFPEVTGEMTNLLLLDMNGCDSIQALPTSIHRLNSLIFLKMDNHCQTTILPSKNFLFQGSAHLPCLRILCFKNHDVVEGNYDVPHNAWPLLEELNLSHNTLTRLPASISQHSRLIYLDLSHSNLEELCELPTNVQVLKANFCKRLQKTDDLSNKYKCLFKISFFCNPLKDRETQSHLDNLLMKSFVQKCAVMNHRLSIVVPGTKLPNWLTNKQFGNDGRLKLPHNQINKMIGLTVCFRFFATLGTQDNFRIKFKRSGEENLIIGPPSGADARGITHVWIGYMSVDILRNLCHGSESEDLIITFEYDGEILECGACVIYEDDINPSTKNGSRITDYEELRMIERDNASVEGRWSAPTFSFGNEKTGDQNTVKVFF